jgi:hypothetical protein
VNQPELSDELHDPAAVPGCRPGVAILLENCRRFAAGEPLVNASTRRNGIERL